MAVDLVVYQIAILGQPPVTTYMFTDESRVRLLARPATVVTTSQLALFLAQIDAFATVVRQGFGPPATPVSVPWISRIQIDVDAPGVATCRYRCKAETGNLTADATITLGGDSIAFEARQERLVAWSDFVLFVAWLRDVLACARRPI